MKGSRGFWLFLLLDYSGKIRFVRIDRIEPSLRVRIVFFASGYLRHRRRPALCSTVQGSQVRESSISGSSWAARPERPKKLARFRRSSDAKRYPCTRRIGRVLELTTVIETI